MLRSLVAKHKTNILYGILLGFLVFLLNWLQWHYLILDYSIEIYVGAIALIFTGLGIWLATRLTKPKIETVVVEKNIYHQPAAEFVPNEKELTTLGISKRELQVLELMAEGLSNDEISIRLFVSINTVKTHTSRIFQKMDVQRRTQAIEKAKRLDLIP
jgi:DNA-binding NarL/FixJ family response regulator